MDERHAPFTTDAAAVAAIAARVEDAVGSDLEMMLI
jgi:creatinine amidohydrolase/Fe(II)-dependent formamide hydrolase-like protein